MAAGDKPRMPVKLAKATGQLKDLSKADLQKREDEEIKPRTDNIHPSSNLPKQLHEKFYYYAEQLVELGLMSNLDCHVLERFLIAQNLYDKVAKQILAIPPVFIIDGEDVINETFVKLNKQLESLNNQCKSSATELCLNVTSRCRLVVPKQEKKQADPEVDPFDAIFGDKLSK